MTYLTKEDWDQHYVQKLCDDKSFSALVSEKIKIQTNLIFFINKLLNSKNNPNFQSTKLFRETLFPSLIVFHKYTLSSGTDISNISYTEKLTLFITCIHLALKARNKLLELEKISNCFQSLFNKGGNAQYEIEDINDLIMNKEFEILCLIQFDVNFDCPFGNFNLIKNYLKEKKQDENIIKTIVQYVNIKICKLIFFPLYLYFTPNEIKISSLLLVSEENKFDFVDINEIIKLSKVNVDKNNIIECYTLMNKIIRYLNFLEEKNKKEKNIKNSGMQEKINFGAVVTLQSNN
jgi:hypothetical protein